MPDRPNVLLIVTDQQCAEALGCAGKHELATPAMDQLAARGVRFERAYCAQPLCVPSRMSMMTGRMPREVGAEINRHVDEDTVPAVPMLGRLLADAGYDCGYVGKWHLTVPPARRDVHGFDFMAHVRDNRMDPMVADGCRAFFAREREGDDARPFFLTAMFVNPHDICEWARGQPLPNDEIGDPPPPADCPPLPANFGVADDEPTALRDIVQPAQTNAYPTRDWPDERWRQYRWAYHRLVERVDAHVGQVLAALHEAGHAEDTVVIFTSDHGDGVGAHHWNQKQALYEECVRVPLIVHDPRGDEAGRVDREHLVSLGLDLMPTLCDYADAAPPAGMQGASLRPLVDEADVQWRDAVFVDTEFCTFGQTHGVRGRMVRTDRFKYVAYDRGHHREQLFDLTRDPGETKNLAADPQFKPVLADHRERLAQWCGATNDPFELAPACDAPATR